MKRLFSLLLLCAVMTGLMAVPAHRKPRTVTQSDGTTLTLQLVGDELMHYYINVESGEKMLQGEDGDYYVVSETVLGSIATKANARRSQRNAVRTNRLKARTAAKSLGDVTGVTGTKKGLVILVNFSDKSMASSHTQTTFNNQFNKEGYSDGGHIGSVHDFFYDQSYGALDLDFDVVGPVTVSKTMSHYGANDSYGNDKYPATMVIEALKLADSSVNYADYDWDGDGEVDQVYVIYAGYGEASGGSSSTIWPHEWELDNAAYYGDGDGAQTLDGVTINTYACSSELAGSSGTTLNGIGTACHEFSHCLGYPDMYDTDYSGGFGMNSWDIMDGGSYNGPDENGEVPAGYTAYERWQAGWLTPTVLSDPATMTGMKPIVDEPEAYIIYNANNENEFFLLENRQNKSWHTYVGSYDTPHGMLIIHGDYSESAWSNNTPNDDPSHQRMTIIPANKTYGSKQSYSGQYYWTVTETQYKGQLFPGTSSVTTLNNSSHSSYGGKLFNRNTDGTYYMNHELTEISESNGNISFLFDGGAVVDDGSRYTITYNAGTGTCATASWTQTDFQESTTLPTALSPSEDWTFVGWSTISVSETTTKPTLLTGDYQPTADVTLYAVYAYSEEGTGSGDYVLVTENLSDWSGEYLIVYTTESKAMNGSQTTLDAACNYIDVTITDGTIPSNETTDASNFTIAKGESNYTIKSASGYYIGTTNNSNSLNSSTSTAYDNTLSYSDGNVNIVSSKGAYLRYNAASNQQRFRYYKSSSYTGQEAIQLYRKGAGSTVTYNTEPDAGTLVTPTITFADGDQTIYMGDQATHVATVENSTGAVTYSSSDTDVVTVDATTGAITPVAVGSAVITGTVAAVQGVSRSAQATYTVTVTMPQLHNISVTTQPTTTSYYENETFDPTGMVITATYVNGYTQVIEKGLTYDPSTDTPLTTSDTNVRVSYTEGDVTVETEVTITVTALPRFTVTLDAGSGTCEATSLTQTEAGSSITLPTAVSGSETWSFVGWATESVDNSTTEPTLLAGGSDYTPTSDVTLYAVYSMTTESQTGSGDYLLVTSDQTDWAGDYLIAYDDTHFANGTTAGRYGIGATDSIVAPGEALYGNTVAGEWGDTYHVTLVTVEGATTYLLQTQDGNYNYRTTTSNGIEYGSNATVAAQYAITPTYSNGTVNLVCAGSGMAFRYNDSANMFRFYSASTQQPIRLYRKDSSAVVTTYTTVFSLFGDVNLDGAVDVNDVTALVDIILGTWGDKAHGATDINGDNATDVNDVTKLVDVILGL